MNELETLRKQIEEIDKKIALLFNERMKVVEKIKKYKKDNKLPTLDKEREEYLLNVNLSNIDKEYQELYQELEKKLLDLSKEYQNKQ